MTAFNWNNAEFQKEASELAAQCAERDAPFMKEYFAGIEEQFYGLMKDIDDAYAEYGREATPGNSDQITYARTAMRDFVWGLVNHPDAEDS